MGMASAPSRPPLERLVRVTPRTLWQIFASSQNIS